MKVESPYRYRLPGRFLLEKGVSEIGEMPAVAREHLDKLIAAGVVKVLPTAAPKPSPAPKPQPKPIVDDAPSVSAENADAVDVTAKRRKKTE